jgi:hypothetical protein
MPTPASQVQSPSIIAGGGNRKSESAPKTESKEKKTRPAPRLNWGKRTKINRGMARAPDRISPPHQAQSCECPPTPSQTVFWSNYLRGLLLVSVTPGLLVTMSIFGISVFC